MLFTAVQAGAIDDGATFGNTSPGTIGVDFPGTLDTLDLNGFDLTQGASTQIAGMQATGGAGRLELSADFNTGVVTDAQILIAAGAVTLAGNITNATGYTAVTLAAFTSLTFTGTIDVTAGGTGISVPANATLTDMSGTITNSSIGFGITSTGTITNISGYLYNSGSGQGILCDTSAVITNISGTLSSTSITTTTSLITLTFGATINNISGTVSAGNARGLYNPSGVILDFTGIMDVAGGGVGIYNMGTLSLFRGTLNVTGDGIGIANFSGGTINNISGILQSSSTGSAIYNNDGTILNISATITSYAGYAINNYGSVGGGSITVSGIINCTGGDGIYNNLATIADISGTLNCSAGVGTAIMNYGTITNISGKINSSAYGNTLYNDSMGTIDNISGVINSNGCPAPVVSTGRISSFTGTLYSSIANLSAANVKKDVAILHVTGTLAAGGEIVHPF